MPDRDNEDRGRGSDLDLRRGYQDRGREQGEPREDRFGRGFEQPEPGLPLEQIHEPGYSRPYDRWHPRDYVFYSGTGYSREFIEPYKLPGEGRRYAGRGPRDYVRSDPRILEDVNERLTEHPNLDATNIEVRVDGGEVTLEGWAPDRDMKRLAEDVAYAVRGVVDVHNHLHVDQRVREIPILPGQPERRGGTPGQRGKRGSPERDRKEGGDVGVRGAGGHSGSGALGSTSFSELSREGSSRAEDADARQKKTE